MSFTERFLLFLQVYKFPLTILKYLIIITIILTIFRKILEVLGNTENNNEEV